MGDKSFVKNILLSKNYKSTLESFSEEEKFDRSKKKSRYFVELIQNALLSLDLELLKYLWTDFENILFPVLEVEKQSTADVLKSELFKAYLVECIKNKRIDKTILFYSTMGDYIYSHKIEWYGWNDFILIKNHSEHKIFKQYFSKYWLENFSLALLNFFMEIVRNIINRETLIEKFFYLDLRIENFLHRLNSDIYNDSAKLKIKFPYGQLNNDDFVEDILMTYIDTSNKPIHDVTELLCDFKLVNDVKHENIKKHNKFNRPKGVSVIIPSKPKILSPVIRKNISTVTNDLSGSKDSLEKIDELTSTIKPQLTSEFGPTVSSGAYSDNESVLINYTDELLQVDSKSSMNNPFIEPSSSNVSPKSSITDALSIRGISNRISHKIFKSKPSTPSPPVTSNSNINSNVELMSKSILFHEHYSMVSHVKFCRTAVPYYFASLDVGGTFKIWNIINNETNTFTTNDKSLSTLSMKHTIYSFDWVSCTNDLILIGTKGGFVKLFDLNRNSFVHEMTVDSLFPRVNILQSFDNEAKFVCQSLDRCRSTIPGSLVYPRGIISLYDAEQWSLIRGNIIESNLEQNCVINCIHCVPGTSTLVAGCNNAQIKLLDTRSPNNAVNTVSIFNDQNLEVVNIVSMCGTDNKDASQYLVCLNYPSAQLAVLDRRYLSKPVNMEYSTLHSLPDLQLPLSWTERPNGGEQIVHIPRSTLLSATNYGGVLFGAAGRKISFQKYGPNGFYDHHFYNCDHSSPIISADAVHYESSESKGTNRGIVVVTGSMEGTISVVKLSHQQTPK